MSLGCATAGAPHRAPSRSEVWDSQPRRRRQGDPDSVGASPPWMPHPLQPMPSSCLLCEPMCLHSMPCGRHAAAVIPVPLSLEGGGCVLPNWHRHAGQRHHDRSPFHRLGIDWVETCDCFQTELSFHYAAFFYTDIPYRAHCCMQLHHLVYHSLQQYQPLDKDDTRSTRWQAHRSAAERVCPNTKPGPVPRSSDIYHT